MGLKTTIPLIILIAILGFFAWQHFFQNSFNFPRSGEESTQTVIIQNGQILDTIDGTATISPDGSSAVPKTTSSMKTPRITTKEIKVTNGVRHSVPLEDIIGGGPPKDGIPSIDRPKFVSIQESEQFLSDKEPGIAVSLGSTHRFYPFQILVWHEIVNDTIGGKRILITYCPLCLSGIVFDPVVQGERVAFGTSGKLWNSNLVMYDRKTDSLWSQILGEAIAGPLTGTRLAVLPSDQTRFGAWKKVHPDGTVLSRDTGITRFYGTDPYGDYYTDNSNLIFDPGVRDTRLQNKDFILGIIARNGKAKAYYPPTIKKKGIIEDAFGGSTIIAEYAADIDAVRIFEKKPNGMRERINPIGSFWFAWVAAHPDTELYK